MNSAENSQLSSKMPAISRSASTTPVPAMVMDLDLLLASLDLGPLEPFVLREKLTPCTSKAELWHIATSLPISSTETTVFAQSFKAMQSLIQEHTDNTQGENTHKSLIIQIPSEINDVLFGSNGVYYLVTARNPNLCESVFTPHMAHCLLYEKHTGSKTGGRSHEIKCAETLTKLKNTRFNIEKALKNRSITSNAEAKKELIRLLEDFSSYLYLHVKLMSYALNYNKVENTASNESPIKLKSAEALEKWHPSERAHQTPQKGKIPTAMIFSDAEKKSITAGPSANPAPSAAAAQTKPLQLRKKHKA